MAIRALLSLPDATVLLSVQAAAGVLPTVLDAERVPWRTVEAD